MKYIKLALKIGPLNIFRALQYRLQKSKGIYKFRLPNQDWKFGPIELTPIAAKTNSSINSDQETLSTKILNNEFLYFSQISKKVSWPIPWHQDSYNENGYKISSGLYWTEAFQELSSHDAKFLWDLSRFRWCLDLAKSYSTTRDSKFLKKLSELVNHWREENAPYLGANWCCGQEASYRVIHLIMAYEILKPLVEFNEAFFELIEAHLKRIRLTHSFAWAQQNNHGVTEAIALWIGGHVLRKSNSCQKNAHRYSNFGKNSTLKLLQRLIQNDGSFSMYSINYHRSVMQTLSFALLLSKKYEDGDLPKSIRLKLHLFGNFLYQLTDPSSGQAPDIGANDGSYPLKLNSMNFKDFRPSVQTFYCALSLPLPYPSLQVEDLKWYEIEKDVEAIAPPFEPQYFPKFSVAKISTTSSWATLKGAKYHFRPSHSDLQHVDLFVQGQNILKDLGTFSYGKIEHQFDSEVHHNTIYDAQGLRAKKVSKFMTFPWLTSNLELKSPNEACCAAQNPLHHRRIQLKENQFTITDSISGFSQPKMRLNLSSAISWAQKENTTAISECGNFKIRAPENSTMTLKTHPSPTHYGQLEDQQFLLFDLDSNTDEFVTSIYW